MYDRKYDYLRWWKEKCIWWYLQYIVIIFKVPYCNKSRVKDFTDPCDCIKDSDDSQSVKKTQIVSMSTLTFLSLINTLLSLKF